MKARTSVRAFFLKVFIGMAKDLGYSSPADLSREVRACWPLVKNAE